MCLLTSRDSSLQARAFTPTQDNSEGQSYFHRLSEGLTEAFIKTISWPKLSLHPVLLSSLPFCKMFPKHFLKNLLLGNLCLRSCFMGNTECYTIQHMSLHNMKYCFVQFKPYVKGIVQFAFLPSNYIFWFICIYVCSSSLFILTEFWKIPQFIYLLPY